MLSSYNPNLFQRRIDGKPASLARESQERKEHKFPDKGLDQTLSDILKRRGLEDNFFNNPFICSIYPDLLDIRKMNQDIDSSDRSLPESLPELSANVFIMHSDKRINESWFEGDGINIIKKILNAIDMMNASESKELNNRTPIQLKTLVLDAIAESAIKYYDAGQMPDICRNLTPDLAKYISIKIPAALWLGEDIDLTSSESLLVKYHINDTFLNLKNFIKYQILGCAMEEQAHFSMRALSRNVNSHIKEASELYNIIRQCDNSTQIENVLFSAMNSLERDIAMKRTTVTDSNSYGQALLSTLKLVKEFNDLLLKTEENVNSLKMR